MAKLTLLVMRHAKSDWSTGLSDHARPLNQRGKREAPITGERLVAGGFVPEVVLSSDAQRTRDTWEKMSTFFPGADVSFHRELYLSELGDVAALAPAFTTPETRTLMVLGHNPGFQEMVLALSGNDIELKTGNCVILTGEADDYRALFSRRDLTLVDVITPKHASDPA